VANSAALVKSAALRNLAASTKSIAGADGNLDSGQSKACEAVMLAACVLAVGNWLVGEHVNAVAAVSGAVVSSFGSSCRQFLMWGRKWPEHGIMGALALQEVRGSLYL
jgi:hypothetical protein